MAEHHGRKAAVVRVQKLTGFSRGPEGKLIQQKTVP